MNFPQFASAVGLMCNSFAADGRIHRCPTAKNPRSKNGAYMLDGKRGFAMAWDSGDTVQWWNDKDAKPWTDSDKKQWAEKRGQEEKTRAEGYEKAASKATQMLSECSVDTHAYLRSKQLPEAHGMVFSDGSLLIPMRGFSTNKLNGVQSISLNSTRDGFVKKFLPGMKAKGSVFKIGSGKKIILVEGYATGLSVQAAAKRMSLDACVMCCFSANNMTFVAKSTGDFVMADNDASKTGENSAIETGLPWVMPEQVGMDWNDVHATSGLMTVCLALKDLFRKVA